MKSVAAIILTRTGVMILAAVFEVAGDALIRAGLRGKGLVLVLAGFAVLGSYGIVVNLLPLDFSKLLGGYVAFFAIVSVLGGRLIFNETVSPSTWVGLAVILVGSLIIQSGAASGAAKPSNDTHRPQVDGATETR
jgi:drug/metabolite transporter superfamily protein YnfA